VADLSLAKYLQAIHATPSQGIRCLTPKSPTIRLRSLIPPWLDGSVASSNGNGTPGLGQTESALQSFSNTGEQQTPDPVGQGLSLCSSTDLLINTDDAGTPVNVDGGPLKIGDSFWVTAVIHFPVVAPDFLMGQLTNQDFWFRLYAVLPTGTRLVEPATLWYALASDGGSVPQLQPLKFPEYPTAYPALGGGVPLTPLLAADFSPTPFFFYRCWVLTRGHELAIQLCLVSDRQVDANELGIAVVSDVGATLHDFHPGWPNDNPIDTQAMQGFCLRCQRVVILDPYNFLDSSRDGCSVCGATGSLIMIPVVPEVLFVTCPFPLQSA